jgi:hypothetical protein
MTDDSQITLTEEQESAVEQLKSWIHSPFVNMMSLSGSAGSGKTTLTKVLKQYLPGNTAWTAMTGRAALRLSQVAGVDAKTLHATIYKPPMQNGKYLNFASMKKPNCQVLIVDESSMCSPKIWEDLKNWQNKGVKILFIGDGHQLPPVMTAKEESDYGDDFIIFREVKGPRLTKVMRSSNEIIEIANYIRQEMKIPERGNSSVSIQHVEYPGISAVEDYLLDRDDHILVTWTNKMRMQGNALIRKRLGYNEPLPMRGEPVVVCKNGQERLNGEIVEVDSFGPGPQLGEIKTMWMTVSTGQEILVSTQGNQQFFDGSMPNIQDWKKYHFVRNQQNLPEPLPVTFGYSLTFHKVQGGEARRVSIYLSESDLKSHNFNKSTRLPDGTFIPFSIRAIYTGLSRAKSRATLYIGT